MFMKYPNSNFNEMNLDWILRHMQELNDKLNEISSSESVDVKAIQEEIKRLKELIRIQGDNITIINNNITNIYKMMGFFLEPVTITNLERTAIDDPLRIVEVS